MKLFYTLLGVLMFAQLSLAQSVDEFGLMLSWEGKLEFSTEKPNPNGNVDNPIKIVHKSDTFVWDMRNLQYNFLSFINGSDARLPSSNDPCSIDYRTTSYGSEIDEWWGEQEINDNSEDDLSMLTYEISSFLPDTLISETPEVTGFMFYCDSAIFHATDRQKYTDDINGCLTSDNYDSTRLVLKNRLKLFIANNSGESYSQDDYRALVKEISQEDSAYRIWVSEDSAKFVYFHDYLINSLDFYEYDEDKLVEILSYDYNSGVHQANFEYDKKGNLIRLIKDHLDGQKEEFDFRYNRKKQVISVTKQSVYFWGTQNEYSSLNTDLCAFKYNRQRKLIWFSKCNDDEVTSEYQIILNE